MIKITLSSILYLVFAFNSYSQNSKPIPGRYIYQYVQSDDILIFRNGIKETYKLNLEEGKSFGEFVWLNNSDGFVVTEYISDGKFGSALGSKILYLDNKLNPIGEFLSFEPPLRVFGTYLSWDDKMLAVVVVSKVFDSKPVHSDHEPASLHIYDMETKTLVQKIDNISRSSDLRLKESPWSPDSKKIVYSVHPRNQRVVYLQGQTPFIPEYTHQNPGIYVYDIGSNNSELVRDFRGLAVWSPVQNEIAVMNIDSVFLYNFDNDMVLPLFKVKNSDQEIKDIHWFPSGDRLVVICPEFTSHRKIVFHEKIVTVAGKIKVEDSPYNFGLGGFNWVGD